AADIKLSAQLLPLITVEDSERDADTGADGIEGVWVIPRAIVRIPDAEGWIGRAVCNREVVIDFRQFPRLHGLLQIRPHGQRDIPEILERHEWLDEIIVSGNIELLDGRAIVQQRQQLDLARPQVYQC